jgi:hypothetical protein
VQACACGWHTHEGKQRQCPECRSEALEHFDSRVEFLRFAELRLMERAGKISNLQRQRRYAIAVMNQQAKPVHGCTYVADFTYIDDAGKQVVEDVKPRDERAQSDVFRLKRRLFEAAYGFPITIVGR